MGKDIWKPGTVIYPVPAVMGSCGTMEQKNIITVAWTGTVNSDPAMTYVSIRPSRHSYNIIKETGEFVINLVTERLAYACDFCGVRSGRDVDKFAQCHLTPEQAQTVSAPMIAECPVSLECRVTDTKELGTHTVFEAEITGVNVDERFLDSKGKLNLQQCGLMAYAHGEYFALGRKLGNFGDSVRKKKKPGKGKRQPGKKG